MHICRIEKFWKDEHTKQGKKIKGYREEQRIEMAWEKKVRRTINDMENGWITR